jgi:hypothetical protein
MMSRRQYRLQKNVSSPTLLQAPKKKPKKIEVAGKKSCSIIVKRETLLMNWSRLYQIL